jgi:hypothetical protein
MIKERGRKRKIVCQAIPSVFYEYAPHHLEELDVPLSTLP